MSKLKTVAFYVSPFSSNGMPLDCAHGAAGKLRDMAQQLTLSGVEVHLLTSVSAANAMRAHDETCLDFCNKIILVEDEEFLAFGGGYPDKAAKRFGSTIVDRDLVKEFASILSLRGSRKSYQIVISFFAETAFLKAVFPRARILFFETGLVCHQPFAQFHSFDPYGTISSGSYIASRSKETLLKRQQELERYRPILGTINDTITAFSAKFGRDIGSLKGLRARYQKIVLLTLQPLGRAIDREYFSHSYEIAEYVLGKLPPHIGLLITEHPSFPEINPEQHAYLAGKYPNYIYSRDLQNVWSPSTICLPLADAVVGVSSTVLLQAHALGIRTFGLGDSCFSSLNNEQDFDAFVSALIKGDAFQDKELEILDLVARYSVPYDLYTTSWFPDYLTKLLSAADGELPLIATPSQLKRHYEVRRFPDSVVKSPQFYRKKWRSRPIGIAANPDSLATPVTKPSGAKAKTTVGVILDHYAIGGTQNVVRRLVHLMPNVHWVIFVERRVKEEYDLAPNCEIIQFDVSGKDPDQDARTICKAVYTFHETCSLDLFINPMHWREAALLAMPRIKKIVGIPVVYWEHNSFFFPMYCGKYILHSLREKVIGDVDRVVLLSPYDQWHFATNFPEAKTQVITNPVPNLEIEDVSTKDRTKSILVVGRFDPQKRMDRILPIVEKFSKRKPDWKLILLGDGYMRPRIEKDLAQAGLSDYVEFKGYHADISEWYQSASIFASLSDFEGDPLTLMEAKAFGLPVVAFELFQNTRLRDNVDGFYVKQGDIDGFVDRLVELANSPIKRAKMGETAQEHFCSFDNKDVVEAWYNLFDDLTSGAVYEKPVLSEPSRAVLQREAVHVAASLENLMQIRMEQTISRVRQQMGEGATKAASREAVSNAKKEPARQSFNQLMKRAEASRRVGNLKDAEQFYKQCEAMHSDRPHLHRLLAELYLQMGNTARAVAHLERAKALRPNNRSIRNRLLKIQHPRAYFWIKDRPFEG